MDVVNNDGLLYYVDQNGVKQTQLKLFDVQKYNFRYINSFGSHLKTYKITNTLYKDIFIGECIESKPTEEDDGKFKEYCVFRFIGEFKIGILNCVKIENFNYD